MTRSEYDLVIMAQMKATSSMGGLTNGNRKRPHDSIGGYRPRQAQSLPGLGPGTGPPILGRALKLI